MELGYSEELVQKLGDDQRKFLWMITIAYILAGTVIASIFSNFIVHRMKQFLNKIRTIGNSSTVPVVIGGQDEIALIDRNFNEMLLRLNENVHREYQLQMEKKAVESELLHAQFNPHFLYNTLSAIRWSVIKRGDSTAGGIIDTLVSFYRATLSRGKHIIPIAKEIDMIRMYIEIQQYTYDKRYHVDYSIAEDTEGLYCLKFLLQPLIENSILHGIDGKNGDGRISISSGKADDRVKITVIDNGRGMSEETVRQLNDIGHTGENLGRTGYGIYNVIKRIKLYYGPEYGIHCESIQGIGTKLEITIPACHDENDRVIIPLH